MSLTVVPIELI